MKKILLLITFLCFFGSASAAIQDYWDGEDYSKNSSSQKEAAGDLMKYVTIIGNEQILDVGCGDGKITAALAKKVPNGSILGIDISKSMIDFAKKAFPSNETPNLQFSIQDAKDIHYPKQFDLIVSFTALQWVQNHTAFVKGAYTSLRHSGILAFTMPLRQPFALEQATKEVTSYPEWSSYFQQFSSGWNFVDQKEYAELLTKNRFMLIRYAVVPQKDIFPSRAIFEAFISQFYPYQHAVPQEKRKQFLKQVVDRFLELETPFPNGEVHWKFPRLEVVAKKN